MRGLSVSDAAAIVGGELHGSDNSDSEILGVAIDSRKVEAGFMFAALKGERVDGHDYMNKAFELGAACCIAERVPENVTGTVIVVPNVAAALKTLAEHYRKRFDIPVIGIAGSVGKTTAKEMVASVLSRKYNVLKTEKNLNNELGVPLTIFRIEPEHEVAVIEMGISGFGEMTALARIAQPTVAVFTVIGHAHLEFLHDLEGVFRAKTEMLAFMPEYGTVIYNGDDAMLRKLACPQRLVSYGLGEDCAVRAADIEQLPDGRIRCRISYNGRSIKAEIPAYGQHMVYAALEGAAVGIEYGLTDDEIIRGIAAYQPVGSRANVVRTARYTVIDDCYNANPDSTAAALRSMATLPAGRRVAILGNMGELGPDAAALHRETGVCAAKAGVSLVITCGDLAREIAAGAAEADPSVQTASFAALDELLASLPELVRPGDCVLVKASHSMAFERIVQALTQN